MENIRLGRITLLGLSAGIIATLIGPFIPLEEIPAAENFSFLQIIIFICIFASIREEVLTRGLLQGFLEPLRKFGLTAFGLRISLPVLVSASVFGLMHMGLLTMGMGIYSVLYIVLFAFIVGMIAGYYGGGVDAAVMRIVDIMFAFPALLLAIVIVAVIGQGLDKAMVAIGIVYTPQMARIIRSSVLYIKEMEYIEVQKAIGSSHWRVMFRHVLPNSIAPVIVYGTLMLATAILDCAALGFLGLGAQPPTPEWGAMLSKSYNYIVSGAWWAATFPGLAILLSVLGLNLLGDGLRDILDPRLKT